ncbi:tRNA (adenosine(37)-N6)-threonylcarbamoyltransferase complex transferase subunit TsaD [Candidatus Falkowbacteria bacterium]|nr:tRNA (adenosine(37)-N6)-threonylcarbamoyltransferase complex transferase subunit TsaD [Candidatus Falkowbacteria bacterium]
MRILALESSCDDTSAAVVESDHGLISVISNVVSSQISLHEKFGGVVPELAAREHVSNILPVINSALKQANIAPDQIKHNIDAIAVTSGPGLVTSLMVGVETAKALAHTLDLPLIGINHIEGHIHANFIGNNKVVLPAIILTVSGGHTNLVSMDKEKNLVIVGQTRDDAAGEAFDKAAQLMGLGYPGGPIVSRLASEHSSSGGQQHTIDLPRPMIGSHDLDFSFSGLKTALLYALKNDHEWKQKIPAYCHSFESAVVDVLVSKTMSAAEKFHVKTILLAGGVSANQKLRSVLQSSAESKGFLFSAPELTYTSDNAAMIGAAACHKLSTLRLADASLLKASPNQEL